MPLVNFTICLMALCALLWVAFVLVVSRLHPYDPSEAARVDESIARQHHSIARSAEGDNGYGYHDAASERRAQSVTEYGRQQSRRVGSAIFANDKTEKATENGTVS